MSFDFALVGFALVTMTALTIEIAYAYISQGFGYGFSSNRPLVERGSLGLRIQRAYQNQVESAAYIVPVLAGAALLGVTGEGPAIAAAIIVFGRAAFVLLCYSGMPFISILGFTCGSLGSLYLAVQCLLMVATQFRRNAVARPHLAACQARIAVVAGVRRLVFDFSSARSVDINNGAHWF